MTLILQIAQFLLLLSVIALAYRTITIFVDARTSSKFVLKGFLQEEEKNEDIKEQITFLERITSFDKYKAYLESELREARMEVEVSHFILKRVVLAFVFASTGLFLYFISDIKLYLYLSVPLGIIAYMMPKRTIKKNKLYYEQQMKIELPEYLSAFAVLLQSYTPYEATKKSKEYAGPLLKPYVEHLITQIELYPASHTPYEEFANTIDLREAKEFVVALNQLMKVDANNANRIISDQIKIMDELQEEAYNEQIEARPDEVQMYITPMLFPLVAIILTFLFVLIGDAFSQIS